MSRDLKSVVISVTLAVVLATAVAAAEPVPEPLAQQLEGRWGTNGGAELMFTGNPAGGLEVVMDGLCESHGASPATEITFVEAIAPSRGVARRPARSCFYAQLCAPQGTRAYCVEWPQRAPAPRLLLLRRDHSRMLRDRSQGNHPLEVWATWSMSRR